MNPAERIVAALEGRNTDSIPTRLLFLDPHIINRMMGLEAVPAMDMAQWVFRIKENV